jgi:opacity protein-like surface antigen
MKNLFMLMVLAALLLSVLPANAQDDTARLEAYGGYDYGRFNINARVNGVPPTQNLNANGGGGQLEYNANNWLGTVGDVAGYSVPTSTAHEHGLSYLFGPRVNFRHNKVTPFTQILLGGVLSNDGIGHFGPENHFAMAAGGGIDLKVSKHISVRPVQAEYFMTTFPNGLDDRQNNFRYSAGIVFRFGRS